MKLFCNLDKLSEKYQYFKFWELEIFDICFLDCARGFWHKQDDFATPHVPRAQQLDQPTHRLLQRAGLPHPRLQPQRRAHRAAFTSLGLRHRLQVIFLNSK